MFLKFCLQKFEGDIERENAESLAADIAEFLNSRRKRSRAGTMPVTVFNAVFYKVYQALPWVPEVIFFRLKEGNDAAKPLQRGARRREGKK